MAKPRKLIVAVSVVFLLSLVSSIRADSVNLPPGLVKLNLTDEQASQLPDIDKMNLTGLLAEHFANNNGKHLGFSVAAFHAGVKFGLANPPISGASVPTQNPEPTGMLLLGTGLAAAAALARRKNRRSRRD